MGNERKAFVALSLLIGVAVLVIVVCVVSSKASSSLTPPSQPNAAGSIVKDDKDKDSDDNTCAGFAYYPIATITSSTPLPEITPATSQSPFDINFSSTAQKAVTDAIALCKATESCTKAVVGKNFSTVSMSHSDNLLIQDIIVFGCLAGGKVASSAPAASASTSVILQNDAVRCLSELASSFRAVSVVSSAEIKSANYLFTHFSPLVAKNAFRLPCQTRPSIYTNTAITNADEAFQAAVWKLED
jgi:hypothetical protein